jgi:hypothetical protein
MKCGIFPKYIMFATKMELTNGFVKTLYNESVSQVLIIPIGNANRRMGLHGPLNISEVGPGAYG